MLKRLPLIPTLVVLAAVALMVRLGLWQVERMHQKDALLASYASNPQRPVIPFAQAAGDERALFRRAVLDCANPVSESVEGAGQAGSRFIVRCADGALVQLGTSRDPAVRPQWDGGRVTGLVTTAPDHRSWMQTMRDKSPARAMLVADPPLAGLAPNARPDPDSIPNNHWSYSIQWFLFALTALVIYGLALRKRLHVQ